MNEKLPRRMLRGAKQIVIPMIRQHYDENWQDAERMRVFVDEWAQLAPELFPEDFDEGYCLHGFGREWRSLPGLLRKIVLADGTPYRLRPSFVTSYMTGTVDQLAYPLLLTAYGVPPWLLTIGFGHATCTGIASPSGWGETVWWEPPSATRHSCPSIWWRTSITPTGPARRATSRQPPVAAAFWASR